MNVLIWFKRDLRIQDHPALALGAALGRVLPLYIVEPDLWAQPDLSARQWDFIAESLGQLRSDLAARGAPLIVRCGPAVEVMARLCRQHQITRILSHEETGNAFTYARDRAMADWAGASGVEWSELPQSGVIRRLAQRGGWQGRRDAFMRAPQIELPERLGAVPQVEPGPIPGARALRLAPDPCAHRQGGGRRAAEDLLGSFLTKRGQPYRAAMSSPLTAERHCTRLSPHIALGTLGLREVVQAVRARQDTQPGAAWAGSLTSLQSRLAWRDHFIQKLEDQPSIETLCLDPRAEDLRPRLADSARLAAWEKGETGLPFVDACLRYLAATGWLNFRMRAMVMATASYHLWLDWRSTGMILARRFTDYEPGIHWPQVQMQSGTTAINTPRIYNPVKQGLDQDPTGAFTRRWCPELAPVPDMHLQSPWRWTGFASIADRRYPSPIVDPVTAQSEARDKVWALRCEPGHKALAQTIAARHASRAGPRRTPAGARSAKTSPDQLSFLL